MPSNHLILCHPLLHLPSIFPSIRIFFNESALRIRWSKYWSFRLSINPSNEHLGFPGGPDGKASACNAGGLGSIPGLGRPPGEENGNPLQYSCLEKFHGLRSLVGYSPWGRKELDMTERLHFTSFRINWSDLLAVQESSPAAQCEASLLGCSSFFMVQLSHLYMTTGKP